MAELLLHHSPTITSVGLIMINKSQNVPPVAFQRGVMPIVNTFIAPNRHRVGQPTRVCDVTTQLVSVAGSHYADCDGCVNRLVLSYGEKGADLCSAPYHKLFSDTRNQPAMKRGEDQCWWKGGWAWIKHAFGDACSSHRPCGRKSLVIGLCLDVFRVIQFKNIGEIDVLKT